MKIIQKLKFMVAQYLPGAPTEVRPDDMTSKKEHGTCSVDGKCCEETSEEKCCDDEGACSCH
ncbi:MAG: hypothetical protein WCT28_04505 [Patescibacteria group bacterium]|jgi:hypothetical protein